MALEPCPGCGGLFEPRDGPVHPYMHSSPACWGVYGEILAAEYSSQALLPIHRLSVDAYAVQHPGGGSRRAIQSVGLHLARLLLQLEDALAPEQANEAMLKLAERKASLPLLAAPTVFQMTVADVAPAAGTPKHADSVMRWARSTLSDWSSAHHIVRGWMAGTFISSSTP